MRGRSGSQFEAGRLSAITPGVVQEYRIHRPEAEKPPAETTLHHELVTLRQILKTAQRHGWLVAIPDLTAPYKSSGKVVHRAWFTPEECKTLYTATRKAANDPENKQRPASQALHDYALFMANTGLRPDEASRLEYRDVKIIDDRESGERILEIEVRGKRGVGYCKSTRGAVRPFERMKERQKPEPTDKLFLTRAHKRFNSFLDAAEFRCESEGSRRTAYSIRHTYICMGLLEGADIYHVAKNCRISVAMIEKYYAMHIKTRLDSRAINVRRSAAQ